MLLAMALVAALVQVDAHPSALECGTDATTRLVPGRAMVMQGPVTKDPGGTGMAAKLAGAGKSLMVTISAPKDFFLAARVMGGGSLVPIKGAGNNANLNTTANCTAQVFTTAAVSTTATYTVGVVGGTANSYVLLGFTDGSTGPGIFVINATQTTQ